MLKNKTNVFIATVLVSLFQLSCKGDDQDDTKKNPKVSSTSKDSNSETPPATDAASSEALKLLETQLQNYIKQTAGAEQGDYYQAGYSTGKSSAATIWKNVGYDKTKYTNLLNKTTEDLYKADENLDYKLGYFKGVLEYSQNLPAKPSTVADPVVETKPVVVVADVDTHAELKSLLSKYISDLGSNYTQDTQYTTALSVGKATAATIWSNLNKSESEYSKLLATKSTQLKDDSAKTTSFKIGNLKGYLEYTSVTILSGTVEIPAPIEEISEPSAITTWANLKSKFNEYATNLVNDGAEATGTFYNIGFNSGKSNASLTVSQSTDAVAIGIISDSGKRVYDSENNDTYRLGYIKGMLAAVSSK